MKVFKLKEMGEEFDYTRVELQNHLLKKITELRKDDGFEIFIKRLG